MNESFERESAAEEERPVETNEIVFEEDPVAAYRRERSEAEDALAHAVEHRDGIEASLVAAREGLGLDGAGDSPVLTEAVARAEAAEAALVAAQADYPGDWTLLMRDRLLDPATEAKFVALYGRDLESLKDGEPGPFDKPKYFKSHYQKQMDDYRQNLEHVMSSTDYYPSGEAPGSMKPSNLGSGDIGKVGTVFSDAAHRGEPLTDRQKNIVEAHEKGHGLREFFGENAKEMKEAFDLDAIRRLSDEAAEEDPSKRFFNYLTDPRELAERIAQVKNYFGLSASEKLTPKHVAYAKEHYLKDIGLDNNMTAFFAGVSSDKVGKFVDVANRFPL